MVSSKKNDIRLSFLGGCGEVGRIGIKLELSGGKSLLLDYGVSLSGEDMPVFPGHVRPKDLRSVFLSHAHLDHSGALPLLFSGEVKVPVYTTSLTARLSYLLLEDFLHISGYNLPFERREVNVLMKNIKAVNYGQETMMGKDVTVRLIDAGHIPGSAMILVKSPEANILFTGDFNLVETQLLNAARISDINLSEVDVVVMETTYANIDHPDRRDLEKEFVESCREVVDKGGIVLIPAFAVGRSQEILCVLRRYDFEYPMTLDGMARHTSKILLNYPEFVRNQKLLREALSRAKWITNWAERRRALKNPGVIVSPAGMLKGGAALYYLQKIYKNPQNAVFLVSYQIEGTPGRMLLETGKFKFNGSLEEVKAQVKWFDFSAHSGHKELMRFLSMLSPETTVFLIHGELDAAKKLASEAEETLELKVILPEEGRVYHL